MIILYLMKLTNRWLARTDVIAGFRNQRISQRLVVKCTDLVAFADNFVVATGTSTCLCPSFCVGAGRQSDGLSAEAVR